MSGVSAGSGCHREDASEQTNAISPATGSKLVRKEEREQLGVCGPTSGSGCHREDASEQTHANSPATGIKQARKEESEWPGVSGVSSGGGHHRGWGKQAHTNVGTSDGQCPVKVLIIDGLDDSSVTKSAANGR